MSHGGNTFETHQNWCLVCFIPRRLIEPIFFHYIFFQFKQIFIRNLRLCYTCGNFFSINSSRCKKLPRFCLTYIWPQVSETRHQQCSANISLKYNARHKFHLITFDVWSGLSCVGQSSLDRHTRYLRIMGAKLLRTRLNCVSVKYKAPSLFIGGGPRADSTICHRNCPHYPPISIRVALLRFYYYISNEAEGRPSAHQPL